MNSIIEIAAIRYHAAMGASDSSFEPQKYISSRSCPNFLPAMGVEPQFRPASR